MQVGSWPHLAARFLDGLWALPLTHGERELVEGWLRSEAEARLFWGQSRSDQRHGLSGALAVARREPARTDLIRAALLHDVGKQRAGLGIVGRTLAALAAKLSILPSGRLGDHLRHDHIGGGLLLQAGCEDLVVLFARYHHSERPPVIDPHAWGLLQEADRSRLSRRTKP